MAKITKVPDLAIHHSICSCQSPEHTLHWMYDAPFSWTDSKGVEHHERGEVWTHVCVSWNQSFFKRCLNAVRYVFGRRSKYGHFDCFVLEKQEAKKLVSFLQDYINEDML